MHLSIHLLVYCQFKVYKIFNNNHYNVCVYIIIFQITLEIHFTREKENKHNKLSLANYLMAHNSSTLQWKIKSV